MAWEVEYTDEFEEWWVELDEGERESVEAGVQRLEERGPSLRFPDSSGVINRSAEAMAKNFRLLVEQMSPESRARSAALAAELAAGLALSDLRGMLDITQADVAKRLGIAQSNVSRLEQREDMLISTLSEFVGALGGTLRLSAVFPEGEVNLTQFDRPKAARSTRGLSALG